MAQRKFDDADVMITIPVVELLDLRASIERIVASEHSRYAAIARWFLTAQDQRPLKPDSH